MIGKPKFKIGDIISSLSEEDTIKEPVYVVNHFLGYSLY